MRRVRRTANARNINVARDITKTVTVALNVVQEHILKRGRLLARFAPPEQLQMFRTGERVASRAVSDIGRSGTGTMGFVQPVPRSAFQTENVQPVLPTEHAQVLHAILIMKLTV